MIRAFEMKKEGKKSKRSVCASQVHVVTSNKYKVIKKMYYKQQYNK